MHRRQVLLGAGATAATLAVAGCNGQDDSTDPAETDDEDEEGDSESTAAETEGDTATEEGAAEDESRETDDPQVADRLNVISTVGLVAEGQVTAVELIVALAPGADPIDLRDVVIQWVDGNGTDVVVAASSDSTATGVDGTFRTTPIKDADDSAPVLNEPNDRLKLSMDLGTDDDVSGADGFGEPLEPEADATLRVTTGSGASSTVRLTVPATLSGARAVTL
jgi:flagellin FlaB